MDKNKMMKNEIFAANDKNDIEKPCIVYTDSYSVEPNMNMGWDHYFRQCKVLCEDGTIMEICDEDEAKMIRKCMFGNTKKLKYKSISNTGRSSTTDTYVREDYWEEYQSYRKRGRSSFTIIDMMAKK